MTGASRVLVSAQRLRGTLHAAVVTALFIQLVVLLAKVQHQWQSGMISFDGAIFVQAAHQISVGDLSPTSTLLGYPYWRSHFELFLWPLAFLVSPFPPVALFWAQAVAMVLAEYVGARWVLDAVTMSNASARARQLLAAAVVTITVALYCHNGSITDSIVGADFHLQAFATLFAVAAARDLWAGQRHRSWVWVALALSTGDVAGTYVAGVGVSALLHRGLRRHGLALVAVGAGWVAFIAVLGANRGSSLVDGYAHVLGRAVPPGLAGSLIVMIGLATAPWRPLRALAGVRHEIWMNLAPTGVIGAVHPWAIGVCGITVIANGLHVNRSFIALGFQNIPIYVFATVGSSLALHSLGAAALARQQDHVRIRAGTLSLAAMTAAFVVAVAWSQVPPRVRNVFPARPTTASEVQQALRYLPAEHPVIATWNVVGRVANREQVYVVGGGGARMTVRVAQPVFVLLVPRDGNQPVNDATLSIFRQQLLDLGASLVYAADAVQLYSWVPPRVPAEVVIPRQ